MHALISRLSNHRVIVLGDLILDEYLIGTATRISREAPVPVLEFESRRLIPGGAANPAANIVSLGSTALQIGVVGDDENGHELRQLLQQCGIDLQAVLSSKDRSTTVKTRIMAHMGLRFPQQVARMDRLCRTPIDEQTTQNIMQFISTQRPNVSAILFSDYHSGLLTSALVRQIRDQFNELLLTADAQGELDKYHQFGLVKCNADEASSFIGRGFSNDDDFADAAITLRQQLGLTHCMVITRGAAGITLATAADEAIHVRAPSVTDVFDTVGAGDTTIAVLTLAVAAGMECTEAAQLANYASGLVVRRVGNYAPTPTELAQAVQGWRQ